MKTFIYPKKKILLCTSKASGVVFGQIVAKLNCHRCFTFLLLVKKGH